MPLRLRDGVEMSAMWHFVKPQLCQWLGVSFNSVGLFINRDLKETDFASIKQDLFTCFIVADVAEGLETTSVAQTLARN